MSMDNKTQVLVNYLRLTFDDYIREIINEPWTRETVLNEDIECCKSTLYNLLTQNDLFGNSDKNIFVFRGSQDGDGKQFYYKKLVQTCYNSIPIPHLVTQGIDSIKSGFRIPIMVENVSLTSFLAKRSSTPTLAEICFIKSLHLNKELQKAAKELAGQLSEQGRLAYFLGLDIKHDLKGYIDNLYIGKSQNKHAPVFIIFSDKEFASEITGGECFNCIDINPLTETQIIRHIATEFPNSPDLLTKIKDPYIIDVLSKQERLLKQVKIWKIRLSENESINVDRFNIEKDYIDVFAAGDDNTRSKLYDAAKKIVDGNKIPDGTLKLKKLEGFFDRNGSFTYNESIFYLIAEEAYNDIPRLSPERVAGKIEDIIKKWPTEVLNYFACFIVLIKRFGIDRYLDILIGIFDKFQNNTSFVPAKVLIDTIIYTNILSTNSKEKKLIHNSDLNEDPLSFCCRRYLDWVINQIKEVTYDQDVFAGFFEFKKHDDCKREMETILRKVYVDTKKGNQIDNDTQRKLRRIVYLYSQMSMPISTPVLKDLFDSNSDMHLRYHIISTLVDLAKTGVIPNKKDQDLILSFVKNVGQDCDVILLCETTTLTYLLQPEDKIPDNYHIDELINILHSPDKKNWEKAHAAGALCKHIRVTDDKVKLIIEEFSTILDNEITKLKYTTNYYYLKTISYIIEAMCTVLPTANNIDRLAREGIEKLLLKHLPDLTNGTTHNTQNNQNRLDSALRMLICGLIHITTKEQAFTLRKNLDEQFSQGCNIVKLLNGIGEDEPDTLILEDTSWDGELIDMMTRWINIFRKQDIM